MPKKPTLVVERVPISSLIPDPENARKHSQANLDAIAGSLRAFGQRRPLVVWGDVIIAGNGTVEAARSLGWEEIDVTRVPADWSHDQARAYALADNRTAELANWDGPEVLAALRSLDDDLLAVTGFTPEDMEDLEKVWGPAPDLDDLADDIGDRLEEDDWQIIRAKVPKDSYERWNECLKATGEKDLAAVRMVIDAAHRSLT